VIKARQAVGDDHEDGFHDGAVVLFLEDMAGLDVDPGHPDQQVDEGNLVGSGRFELHVQLIVGGHDYPASMWSAKSLPNRPSTGSPYPALLAVPARHHPERPGRRHAVPWIYGAGVAKRLLGLAAKSSDGPPTSGTVIDRGLPQTDLAYLCGGTRANVSRVLSEFGRRQLIERAGRQYILRDVDALRRLAGL